MEVWQLLDVQYHMVYCRGPGAFFLFWHCASLQGRRGQVDINSLDDDRQRGFVNLFVVEPVVAKSMVSYHIQFMLIKM